jgi:hypothetical protein
LAARAKPSSEGCSVVGLEIFDIKLRFQTFSGIDLIVFGIDHMLAWSNQSSVFQDQTAECDFALSGFAFCVYGN